MIRLKHVRLINWYGFANITVPIGFFTLVAGKNGNGKSVFLDAIKYALYGDTVFNKSSENRGSRTVLSYTRGLLDATAETYMRPAERVPNVYTHIVLEMEDDDLGKPFLLGTVIDTGSANDPHSRRYMVENATLEDMEHTYVTKEGEVPYSAAELQKKYNLRMFDVREGLSRFMQRTGLRFSDLQLSSFKRKLRSVMSYDPNAKIDRFIRESVLEAKPVDFSKLIDAKTNIDRLNESFAGIDREINQLDKVLAAFEDLEKAKNTLIVDDIKILYNNKVVNQETMEKAKVHMDTAERKNRHIAERLQIVEKKEKETGDLFASAARSLEEMDCAKAIRDAKKALEGASGEKETLAKEKEALEDFAKRVNALVSWLSERNIQTAAEPLQHLDSGRYDAAEKENAVHVLQQKLRELIEQWVGEMSLLKAKINDVNKQESYWLKKIADYTARKETYGDIPEYVGLRNEINAEFNKRGISSKACFASEYVLGIKDEAWRDTLEGYLGRRRYTLLVEPEYYDIADDVLNHSKYKYAHLFNTKLLMQKTIETADDSASHLIETNNPVARQYFDYQLGRFHAVKLNEVRNYENALSKEGRVSVAMDSYFLRFDRIRFYCLGQEALAINLKKAEKERENCRKTHEELRDKVKMLQMDKDHLETALQFFVPLNYSAISMYESIVTTCAKRKAELEALEKAQADNSEYMELAMRVSTLEEELSAIRKERAELYEARSKNDTDLLLNKGLYETAEKRVSESAAGLKDKEVEYPLLYEKAIREYDRYAANGRTGAGGPLKDRQRAENNRKNAGEKLREVQVEYNVSKTNENQIEMKDDNAHVYRERRNHIWMDDRESIRAELAKQTRRYEDIFKNEFVLTVLKYCETARSDLARINLELSRLHFKSEYKFDVHYVKDGSDYEKILNYAKYLKDRELFGARGNQMTLEEADKYDEEEVKKMEGEMRSIINRIIEKNGKDEIEHFADYRNYMNYEILLTNDALKKARLSRQSGYNSGAEVQIPYLLILLSALLMIYNDKTSSTRLVFIDEPFAKMDPSNIRIMMGFMKQQNLQMIFCAPDKTELIGSECDVILPVLRTRIDLMEMGSIEMKA